MKWKNPVQLLLGLFETEPPSVSRQAGEAPPPQRSNLAREAVARSTPEEAAGHPRPLEGSEAVFEYPPRLRKSWRLVRRDGVWICEVPAIFRDAPVDIQNDLVLWVRCALHPSPGSRAKKKAAQVRIFGWLSPQLTERVPHARPKGETWDLQELFEGLNRRYFGGALQAVVRWSPKVGGVSTHRQIRAGDSSHHVLTISRAYDGPDVPRVAVEGVLYHEMCHIAHPPRSGEGAQRRHVHHAEFRKAERRFEGFAAWRQWEHQHLHRQLRRLKKRLKNG